MFQCSALPLPPLPLPHRTHASAFAFIKSFPGSIQESTEWKKRDFAVLQVIHLNSLHSEGDTEVWFFILCWFLLSFSWILGEIKALCLLRHYPKCKPVQGSQGERDDTLPLQSSKSKPLLTRAWSVFCVTIKPLPPDQMWHILPMQITNYF